MHTHNHTHITYTSRHKINPALSVTFYTIRSAMAIVNVVTFDLSIRSSIKNEYNFNILEVERLVNWSLSVNAL